MTLHVVIGEGKINKRELTHQLDDLREAATAADTNFWFILEGKETPTDADRELVDYCLNNELYFATIAADGVELDEVYATAEEHHTYEGDFATSLIEAMTELQEDEEGADLLTILVNPKDDDPGDEAALPVIEAVVDAGFHAYGLNDSMEEIKLEAPAPAPTPAKTGGAKKAAGATKKAAAAAPEPEAEPEGDTTGVYTRAELEGLTAAEVKAIASGQGSEAKGKPAQINAILAAQGTEILAPLTSGSNAVTTWSSTSSVTGTPGTVNPSYNGAVGWETVPTGKVLIAMIAPNGSVVTKMVDVAKVAAL